MPAIGAPSRAHLRKVERELRVCRDTMERELGTRPTLFAYPNGDTNPAVTELVGRYYTAAFTTCPSVCPARADTARIMARAASLPSTAPNASPAARSSSKVEAW